MQSAEIPFQHCLIIIREEICEIRVSATGLKKKTQTEWMREISARSVFWYEFYKEMKRYSSLVLFICLVCFESSEQCFFFRFVLFVVLCEVRSTKVRKYMQIVRVSSGGYEPKRSSRIVADFKLVAITRQRPNTHFGYDNKWRRMNVSHEYKHIFERGTNVDLALRTTQISIEKWVVEANDGRKIGRITIGHTPHTHRHACMKWSNKNYVMLAAIWSYVIWS